MLIDIASIGREHGIVSPDLLTREVGKIFYRAVRERIKGIQRGETVIIDFSGVKVIDLSFIDEMLVKLLIESRQEEHPFFIKLRGCSEMAEMNIDMVLKSYSSYSKKKMVVITENICHNNAFYLGALTDRERDIVEFLRINRTASQEDIARLTGVSVEEAAALMEELSSARAIRLEAGGICSAL